MIILFEVKRSRGDRDEVIQRKIKMTDFQLVETHVTAMNPFDNSSIDVVVQDEKIRRAQELGLSECISLACYAPAVLLAPDAVFRDVVKFNDPNTLCYVKYPEYTYDEYGDAIGPCCAGKMEIYIAVIAFDTDSCMGILRENTWDLSESPGSVYPKNWNHRFNGGRVL